MLSARWKVLGRSASCPEQIAGRFASSLSLIDAQNQLIVLYLDLYSFGSLTTATLCCFFAFFFSSSPTPSPSTPPLPVSSQRRLRQADSCLLELSRRWTRSIFRRKKKFR